MNATTVLLSLGSNIGDRYGNLRTACSALQTSIINADFIASHFYETEPVGYKQQPDFINMCVCGTTLLQPIELFTLIKELEQKLGRIQREQWHEREIDIDILLYGSEIVLMRDLHIPHPRMQDRRFVLMPAAEIAAEMIHPVVGADMLTMLKQCIDTSNVQQIQTPI